MIIYFLIPFVGVSLLAIGFGYKEYIAGLLGGLVLALFGVGVLLNPITVFSSTLNVVLGVSTFGFGFYIFIRGGVEEIQRLLPTGIIRW